MTVPGKGPFRAYNDFSVLAFIVLPHLKRILRTKLFCLSQWYIPYFAYTHAKFERVEALIKGQACCLKTATKSSDLRYDLNGTG